MTPHGPNSYRRWCTEAIESGVPGSLENGLLSRLSPNLSATVTQRLTPVTLGRKQTLFEMHEPIAAVYFPVTAVCSLISVMRNGKKAEIATVGREGMIGGTSLFGARALPFRAICQIPGEALMMPSGEFTELTREHGELRMYLERYMRAHFVQVAQSSACNSVHDVTRRTARWLLLTRDRAGSDDFEMTQDLLAEMLGVRRATVTEAASDLQRRGLISYRRGRIHIADPRGLEAASCECYGVIRQGYEAIDDDGWAK